MSQSSSNVADPTWPVWQEARLLEINGATAADFLQGYLTCDTQRISSANPTPMAICTLKGRVLASGWALALPTGIGLVVHASLAPRVAEFLQPYVNFSKCEIVPNSQQQITVGPGPSGIQLLPELFISLQTAEHLSFTAREMGADLTEHISATLVANQFAFISAPVSELYLPQMLGLDQQGAVDFDKGCYLGQEIVARAQFRGAVKRTLVTFQWQHSTPVIGENWQEVGVVIDFCGHGAQQGSGLALAKTS